MKWATPPRGELDRFNRAGPAESYVEIGRLLTQARQGSPVRSIAESVLGNTYPPGTSVLPVFSALANTSPGYWRERVIAAWTLARVPLDTQERDAAAGMLLESLEQDDDQTVWERFLHGLLWGYGAMLPLCLVWSLMICRPGDSMEWGSVFPQMLFFLGSLASIMTIPLCIVYGKLTSGHDDLLRAASAEALGRLDIRESVGPLAEKLFDPSVVVREAASFGLLEILPRIKDTDTHALDPHAVARLSEALNHPNTLLVFKILEALKKVGTGSTLPAVERLIQDAKTRPLQEAARQTAVVLHERRRREREAQHLMRPTSAPEASTGYILNTADFDVHEAPLQTLRSGGGFDHDWL